MNELIKNVGVLKNFKEWPSAETFWGNKKKFQKCETEIRTSLFK